MANCNCGNVYNVGMGCCEPVLGPIENYYTKYQVDKLIEGAVISGCCITPEEVDEKIEEAISGITVSGVTEEELQEAIDEAKTEIEGEIPSLSGYATEQWVLDKNYITGVDLSNYSTTEQMNGAISAATDGLASEEYVNNQISSQTADFVDGEELSSYTYDKATIDSKIASGGTFDPTKYYTKSETSGATQIQDALNIISGSIPAITSAVTSGSTACITSGGVYEVVGNIEALLSQI